jgi:hypothetical protein
MDTITAKDLADLLEQQHRTLLGRLNDIHQRLATVEQQLSTLPYVEFIRNDDIAKTVIDALRRARTQPKYHENLTVPPDTEPTKRRTFSDHVR